MDNHRSRNMVITCLLVLLLCLVFATWTHNWVSQSTVVEGQVIELVGRSTAENGKNYAPKIRYELAGKPREFTSGWSSNPPIFTVGQTVKVLISNDGERVAIASLITLYGIPILISCIALCLAMITIIFRYGEFILHLLHPQLL